MPPRFWGMSTVIHRTADPLDDDTPADPGTARRIQALHDARRRDSQAKRAHVRNTVGRMLLDGEPITFTSVARRARVSTWLVYADGVREQIRTAIEQQACQPDDHRNDHPASIASLRTDLALARDEIKNLRSDNGKFRHTTQRLLGQQLDQIHDGDLVERIDALVEEKRCLAEQLHRNHQREHSAQVAGSRARRIVAAARTALRRMIREQTSEIGP